MMHSESTSAGAVARHASGARCSVRVLRLALLAAVTTIVTGCGAAAAGTEPNFVAVDLTPPSVIAVTPLNAATAIAPNAVVTATFSEPLNAATANGSSFTLTSPQGTSVAGAISISGSTATFTPAANLEANTQYTATITRDVKDAAGNAMAASYAWMFRTAPAPDVTAPTVIATTPASGATGVAFNSTLSATFSEAMTASSLTASSVTLVAAGGAAVTGVVSVSGNTVTFAPTANLAASTQFTAIITTAARDASGNALASNYTWSFTTGAAADVTPPTITAITPANGATGVAVGVAPSVTFSEAMTTGTLTTTSFTLVASGGATVPGTVTVSGTTATFTPTTPLASNTQYTATVTNAVKDAAGNALAANAAWSFFTAVAADVTAPTITGNTPANGATNVAVGVAPTVSFSEAMQGASLNTSSFTLVAGSGAAVSGTVTLSGTTATFTPSAALAAGMQYTATITNAAKDAAGNALAANASWSFTTASATDVTPPTITGNTPANSATNVPVGTAPTVTFSEPMSNSTLTGSFTLSTGAGASVAGIVTVSGNTATFTPSAVLAFATQYTATVTTAAKDAVGNALAANATWSFTTAAAADVTAPTISGNTPTNGATNVAIASAPTVTFSESMLNSTLNTTSFTLVPAGGAAVAGTVTVSGNTATFTPAAALAYSRQYTATITTAARDAAGNALAANSSWSFTTGVAPDVTPPTISANTPANGASNVLVGIAPTLTFSEPMQNATVNASSFTLQTTAGSVPVAGTVTVAGNTATFTPGAALTTGTQYTARITTAAKDLAGNALAANASWNFTTELAPVTSLVIAPSTTSVVAGGTQQFTVTGRRTGDATTPVAVTVNYSATGGTITSGGLFTAGVTAGSTFRVTAVLSSNNAVSVQANVTVTPPLAVQPGTWVNVTPGNVNLSSNLSCGNYGTENVQVDPNQPSNFYAQFHCQGIWKSVDFGRTWTGPINTGSNGATVSDCAGGIRLAPNGVGNPPILYQGCIRGAAIGFWRSLDGGVNWTRYNIAPAAGNRQDVYPPSVDPYDSQHLIMAGHEQDLLVESVNGGQTWTNVPINAGMRQGAGTASISFINTGNASGTRGTFLWMAQQSGGVYGTWRTTTGGASWTQVDKNEHPHGFAEAHQPDASGVIYIAGAYSQAGWGVLRSADYGVTWAHVGSGSNQRAVISTPKAVYGSYSYPTGLGATDGPSFQLAAQPGTSGWTSPATPAGMRQGASQAAVGFDGSKYYMVTANYGAGLWLYIEP